MDYTTASDLLETHRSFVNTWESDENSHMNVQFYLKRFDEAARFFDALSGNASTDRPLPADRHVRYHAELHAGATTVVRSAEIADGEHAGRVVHFLDNAETGNLAATAIDMPSELSHRHRIPAETARRAMPRSASAGPLEPIAGTRVLEMGGLVANRSIVQPGECDSSGAMLEQFHIARFSDAAPHAWRCAGIDVEWLRKRNLGRVAVEMKITHHAPARAGEAVVLYSMPSASSGRTVTLRHEIVRFGDDTPIASGEVVALIIDLKTRKSIGLPASVVRRMGGKPRG